MGSPPSDPLWKSAADALQAKQEQMADEQQSR